MLKTKVLFDLINEEINLFLEQAPPPDPSAGATPPADPSAPPPPPTAPDDTGKSDSDQGEDPEEKAKKKVEELDLEIKSIRQLREEKKLQEIKEEHKAREGDPLIKARIRKVQREVANRKMMSEVPKGDVVVTNPTHIACVLKYSDKLPAPQLIAKGADLMAEKIKQIAREHNIPIVENKPLARTMFKTMKVGQVIPRELFVAVAEVLSYVYRLRRKKKKNQTRIENPAHANSRY